MADDRPRDARSPAFQLEYKTVLGGAGTLIVLLAGFTWGLFNSNHQDEVDTLNRANTAQWERIRTLNDQLIESRTEAKTLRRDVDDQEVRIRALEHRGDKR